MCGSFCVGVFFLYVFKSRVRFTYRYSFAPPCNRATIETDLIRFSGAFGKRRLELGKLDEELAMPLSRAPHYDRNNLYGRVFLGAASLYV